MRPAGTFPWRRPAAWNPKKGNVNRTMTCCALQRIRTPPLAMRAFPHAPSLVGGLSPVRSLSRSRTALSVPRSRCAVGPCPGLAVFRRAGNHRLRAGIRRSTPFGLDSSCESSTAIPSRAAHRNGTSHGLSCPFSTCRRRRSTVCGFASPASFRPQGLATLSTACSRRCLSGLVSSRQRSWAFPLRSFLLPQGNRGVVRREAPTYRFPVRCALRRSGKTGPNGRGSWALLPAGIPGGCESD